MAIYDIYGSCLMSDAAVGSILKGKSLCCVGDSLTAGAGVNNVFSLTFGGICADQNGMSFTNAGTNGATITTCNATNNFMLKYQNIKEHDYLVFWYGFNDFRYGPKSFMNVYCQETYGDVYDNLDYDTKMEALSAKDWDSIFVGDIDGTDSATWCGAWNTVLSHFTKTYPDMHIGVILPIITSAALKEPMRNALVRSHRLKNARSGAAGASAEVRYLAAEHICH